MYVCMYVDDDDEVLTTVLFCFILFYSVLSFAAAAAAAAAAVASRSELSCPSSRCKSEDRFLHGDSCYNIATIQ